MDVEKIFHMKGGHGNTSYARNSSLQKKGSDTVKHVTTETIQDLYQSLFTTPLSSCCGGPPSTITVADMGCASGPNTLSTIRDIYHAVAAAASATTKEPHLADPVASGNGHCQIDSDDCSRQSTPELFLYLNDLPSNDFNSIFKSLPDLYSELQQGVDRAVDLCPSLFVSALPGSFYSRLFPCNSLHFVYSSYSLHWLSKVPLGIYDQRGESMNKGNIYISKNSPPRVIQAYQNQFRADFSSFLRLRSVELLDQVGRMVLILLGRKGPGHNNRGNSFLWELFTQSFHILISRGLVKSEMLDSYDVHFYAPSRDEVEEVVKEEGSFRLNQVEHFSIENGGDVYDSGVSHGEAIARTVRAIQEPLLSSHFGEGILDELFKVFCRLIDEEVVNEAIRPVTLVLVLTKV